MNKRLVTLTVALVMTASLSMGCIGKGGLSAKVQKFNLETVDGRWERWGLFVGLYFIPVYPFAGAVDLLIVNSIEFWTGTNPVTNEGAITPGAAQDDLEKLESASRSFTTEDGSQVTMTHELDDTVTAVVTSLEGETRRLTISRDFSGIYVKDERGEIMLNSSTQYLSPELVEIL
jgi:hypothetical protein